MKLAAIQKLAEAEAAEEQRVAKTEAGRRQADAGTPEAGEAATETAVINASAKPAKAARKAKGGAHAAKGASAKGKATKKATPAKSAPKPKRSPRFPKPLVPARAARLPRWWRCSSGRTEQLRSK